jgi:hypothetical protein
MTNVAIYADVLACVTGDLEAAAVGLASFSEADAAVKAAALHTRAALEILYGAIDAALAAEPADGGEPITRVELLDRWRTLGFTSSDGFRSDDLDRSLTRWLDRPDMTDDANITQQAE